MTEDKRDDTSNLKHRLLLIDQIKHKYEMLRDGAVDHLNITLKWLNHELGGLVGSQSTPPSSQKEVKQAGKRREKIFNARSSPLTELLEINHFQAIHHIFVAVLFNFYLRIFVKEYLETGTVVLKSELFTWFFGQTEKAIFIWLSMIMSTIIIVFVGFRYWAKYRSVFGASWDWSWLSFYVIYLCVFIYYPANCIISNNLPPGSSAVVLFEQVRLVMKTHSFVRQNVQRILATTDFEKGSGQIFSNYVYFLFIPTLIYRDNYPRNSQIRWGYVLKNVLHFIGSTTCFYFVCSRSATVFQDFGLASNNNFTKHATAIVDTMLPAATLFILIFFGVFESWFNIFAEILTFADRQFYKDWWNAASYASFFRTWNIVVQDWLHVYVYKDVRQLLPSNRYLPLFSVFFISAFAHDYVVATSLKFFLPVMLFLFGFCGMILSLMPATKHGNVFFWISLVSGCGLVLSCYYMEWYARKNCDPYSVSSAIRLSISLFLACGCAIGSINCFNENNALFITSAVLSESTDEIEQLIRSTW